MADRVETTIDDPGLYLLTDRGEVLPPVSKEAGRFIFIVPETASGLRLRSRAARLVDEDLLLGVRVGVMKLTRGGRAVELRPDDSAPEAGWHEAGDEPGRWTNGDAALRIPDNNGLKLPGVLEILVLAVGPYALAKPGCIAA